MKIYGHVCGIFIILQLGITTALQSSEEKQKIGLFVTKYLRLYTDVVQDLRTTISEVKEEFRVLKANMSETIAKVEDVQIQSSKNTLAIQTNGSINGDFTRNLQTNVSEHTRTIQNLESMISETEMKITNLTMNVSQNTEAAASLQSYSLNANSSFALASNRSRTPDNISKPKDCLDLQIGKPHSTSGVYEIFPIPGQLNGTKVYCDLDTNGGGWTVIQSRSDKGTRPRVNFYRGWKEYEQEFGSPGNEYWIGLRNLAAMTASEDQELQVELTNWSNEIRVANYLRFQVADVTEKYRLSVSNFTGTAGDALADHNGMFFTTKDRDNDNIDYNCAQRWKGGWWYNNCYEANLNGDQNENTTSHAINWQNWDKHTSPQPYTVRAVQMKIRTRYAVKV